MLFEWLRKSEINFRMENLTQTEMNMLLVLIPNKHLDAVWNSQFNMVNDYKLTENYHLYSHAGNKV
jgi:hypothetical protein